VGNFDSYFPSPSTGKSATPTAMDICHIYTPGVSLEISHGRIKEAKDTNLLEVVGSSETARTLAACDHLNSIMTTILRLLAYSCLNAIWEQARVSHKHPPRMMTTTSTKQSYRAITQRSKGFQVF